MLSIELISTFFVRIQNVAKRCCIFGETRCENDHFIEFTHPFQELVNTWSYENIDLTNLALDFNWEHDIGILDWFELRMDEGLIQIKDKRFSTHIVLPLGPDQRLLILILNLNMLLLLLGWDSLHARLCVTLCYLGEKWRSTTWSWIIRLLFLILRLLLLLLLHHLLLLDLLLLKCLLSSLIGWFSSRVLLLLQLSSLLTL